MIISWSESRNIENSLIDFLKTEIVTESVQLLNDRGSAVTPNVYRGKHVDLSWNLPLIQLYCDNKFLPRLEIGTNLRLKSYLIFVEVRTLLSGQETDLADWVEEKLNDGCNYYTYAIGTDPEIPLKTFAGHINIDFQSSNPVNLGDDADKFDKYRYRLVLRTWLNKKG